MLLAAAGIGIGHAVLPYHWMPLALLARTRRYPARRVLRLSLAAATTHVAVSLLSGAAVAAVGLRFRETVAQHADLAVGGVLVATGVALMVLEALGRGHGHSHTDHEHDHAREPGDLLAIAEPQLITCRHAHLPAARSHLGQGPASAAPHLLAQAARRIRPGVAVLEHPLGAPAATPEPRRRNILTLVVPFGAVASPDLTILPLFLPAGALGMGPALGVLTAFALATVTVMVGLTMAATLGARRLTAPWIEERANALTAATLLVIGVLVIGGAI
jgi:hypothetical protein